MNKVVKYAVGCCYRQCLLSLFDCQSEYSEHISVFLQLCPLAQFASPTLASRIYKKNAIEVIQRQIIHSLQSNRKCVWN